MFFFHFGETGQPAWLEVSTFVLNLAQSIALVAGLHFTRRALTLDTESRQREAREHKDELEQAREEHDEQRADARRDKLTELYPQWVIGLFDYVEAIVIAAAMREDRDAMLRILQSEVANGPAREDLATRKAALVKVGDAVLHQQRAASSLSKRAMHASLAIRMLEDDATANSVERITDRMMQWRGQGEQVGFDIAQEAKVLLDVRTRELREQG